MKIRILSGLFAFALLLTLTACNRARDEANVIARAEEEEMVEKSRPIEASGPTAEMVDTPNSTCFSAVGYDKDAEILFVQFRESGTIYSYDNVPQEIYDEMNNADSMGGYYNRNIKGVYTSTRLS